MPTQTEVDIAVSELSNVGKLVHLAFRSDFVDTDEMSATLFKQMRHEYEAELTALAQSAGCDRKALLGNNAYLTDLRDTATLHADSISRTYNYELAKAITFVRMETPTANRHVYAKRLGQWEANRAVWKNKQIALMTVQTARQQAKGQFLANNLIETELWVMPKTAAEPICQGLVAGAPYPQEQLGNIRFPAHLNCPHYIDIRPKKLSKADCSELWLGQ